MYRYRRICLSLALLALVVGTAEAHPARHPRPVVPQPRHPRLVIAQADGGFFIRCETPREQQNIPFPRGAIPLGASVHIDRTALLPSQQKDISHGETR